MKEKHSPKPNPADRRSAGFPKKAMLWTLFCIVVASFLHWQKSYLNLQFGLDPAIPWIATALFTFITWLVWCFWTFLYQKNVAIGLALVAIPVGFFTLFYPDFGGDASFLAFRPRFWDWRSKNFAEQTELSVERTENSIDPTPYDFPQFLGPKRDLRIENVKLTDQWGQSLEKLWQFDVGEGWSGFAVVNGLAVTQEQRDAEECTTCYDALSGQVKWIYRAKRRHEDPMAMGKIGPRATPTIDGNFVYTTSGTGVLDCLDLRTGELVWSADVPKLVGVKQQSSFTSRGIEYTLENSALAWGRSCSPLIYQNSVIVAAGGPKDVSQLKDNPTVTLIAFDKVTGEERWRGGNRMIAYGSPNIAVLGGQPTITLVTQDHAVGHDAETGEELWAIERLGSSDGDANCSQVTLVGNDQLLLTKGYGMGGELITVSKNDDGSWDVTSNKKDPRILKTKFTNPVIVDGHAYSLSDGFFECVSLADNNLKQKWRQRGRFGNGQILAVGNRILVHSEDGELFLIEANPDKFVELAKFKTIEGFCWNTLCLYGDLLLVRSELEAACFRLPTENGPIMAVPDAQIDRPSSDVQPSNPDDLKSESSDE